MVSTSKAVLLILPDGAGEAELGFSGKMGIGADVSESFGLYGEVSAAKFDDVDAGYGGKLGAKYKLLSYNSDVSSHQTARSPPCAERGGFLLSKRLCKSIINVLGVLGFVMSGTTGRDGRDGLHAHPVNE